MAVTLTPAVLVHVEADQPDPSTGHFVRRCVVSVLVPREVLHRINWEGADASEVVGSLTHRMKLQRSKGFVPAERLALS